MEIAGCKKRTNGQEGKRKSAEITYKEDSKYKRTMKKYWYWHTPQWSFQVLTRSPVLKCQGQC